MLHIKGTVVVYSIVGCPHCSAAKKSLIDAGLPFIDVSVEKFPAVRTWLQDKTGKTSVPQIFFNETYIGGNDSLQKIKSNKEEWQKLINDVTDNEAKEGEQMIPHPSDAVDEPTDGSGFVCEKDPDAEVAEELLASGILHNHRTGVFSTAKNAFSGQQFVEWITESRNIGKETALKLGTALLSKKYIKSLKDLSETAFMNDAKVFYSLIDSSESKALNGGLAKNCAFYNASDLAEALRKLILHLYSDYISEDGKSVNYKEMKETEAFKEYLKLSRELQHVNIENLSDDEKKAFFINIYNALVIHATIESGPPTNWWTRLKFFDKTEYIIGGHHFSLNDIENGILRGNKRGVVQWFPPFGKSDPRRFLNIPKVDPRIHFALNCGAKSCPPIKTFSADSIDDELRLATEAYLEQDDALRVDEENNVIHLSTLLRWYASDFGENTEDILQWVLSHVAFHEKREALERILESKNWKVQYLPYDWSSNAHE